MKVQEPATSPVLPIDLGDLSLPSIAASLARNRLPSGIFSDPALYELELERLFLRTWLFVGHESEIPEPGDYVVRRMAGESVLLVRGTDGQCRVLLNTCRHRGNLVCRTERGNAASFQCAYHGWLYEASGALLQAPGTETYAEPIDQAQLGLVAVPQVDNYNGLIFANFDATAPTLDDYLGATKWYLDILTRRSDVGLEVIGAPHRWIIPANWKLAADQFTGDMAHFPFTHMSAFSLGTWPRTDAPPWVANIALENGHCAWIRGVEAGHNVLHVRGYPDNILASLRRNLSPPQAEVLERAPSIGGNLLPNLSFMDLAFAPEPGAPASGYLSLRLWNPLAVDQTEVWSWCLVEKDTPAAFKESGYAAYLRGFGPSGTFEQDDMAVWVGATQTAKGPISRRLLQNIAMGSRDPQRDPTFAGPGDVVVSPTRYFEANVRAFYRAWLGYLLDEA
jgi:PAH dioxygenase large subunit